MKNLTKFLIIYNENIFFWNSIEILLNALIKLYELRRSTIF